MGKWIPAWNWTPTVEARIPYNQLFASNDGGAGYSRSRRCLGERAADIPPQLVLDIPEIYPWIMRSRHYCLQWTSVS